MSALDYFLKANLFLLLFYGCYWLLLRRHTFFGLNRAYLLGAVATSLLLPLVELPNQAAETIPVPVGVIALPTVEAVPAVSADVPPEMNWEAMGQWAYVLVAVLLLVGLGARLLRLVQLIRRSPQELQNGFVLVRPIDERLPTFSFFRYVVLNPADEHNELILRHELVHVRQWHSADILALEMLRAACWLCPALWLYDRAVRQVHEFQADQAAAQSATYARFLVAYAFGVQPDSLANGFFNPSLLRQRLQMLGRRSTNRWALGKYALVLPLALGLLAMTSVPEEVAAIVDESADKFITISGRITAPDGKPLPGASIEVKGASRGTSTDPQGRYVFSHVFGKDTLVVGFVGFKNQQVPVNNRTVINVQLAPQQKKVGLVEPNQDGELITVTGRVTSYPDGKPLEGALVVNANTGKGTPTDAQGHYKLTGVSLSDRLAFSHVGYRTDVWMLEAFQNKVKNNQLFIGASLQIIRDELPPMGATAAYKVIKPNPDMPVVASPSSDVEEKPYFPTGVPGLMRFIAQALRYPTKAKAAGIEGDVYVLFTVLPTGAITNVRVNKNIEGVGSGCEEEAVRVVKLMPKWVPAKQNGRPVAYEYMIPIRFAMEKQQDKRTSQAVPSPSGAVKPQFTAIHDNSPNARYLLVNDVKPRSYPAVDSMFTKGRTSIRVRGLRPFGENPLYIVDGVRTTADTLKTLNQKDIQSVEVVKSDMSAMYGKKAKDGVVIITMKKS